MWHEGDVRYERVLNKPDYEKWVPAIGRKYVKPKVSPSAVTLFCRGLGYALEHMVKPEGACCMNPHLLDALHELQGYLSTQCACFYVQPVICCSVDQYGLMRQDVDLTQSRSLPIVLADASQLPLAGHRVHRHHRVRPARNGSAAIPPAHLHQAALSGRQGVLRALGPRPSS